MEFYECFPTASEVGCLVKQEFSLLHGEGDEFYEYMFPHCMGCGLLR